MKNEKKIKDVDKKDWKESVLEYGQTIIKNFSIEIINNAKDKVRQSIIQLKGNVASIAFLSFGLILLIVGLSKIIDYYTNLPGAGYLILGFLVLILGLLVKVYYSEKK